MIWSPASVKSAWVISEAMRAFKQNKLIQVRTPDLPISNIPPPFDVVHCSPVGDRAAIFNALRQFGIGEGAIEGDAPAEPASGGRRLWLASAAIAAGVVLAVAGFLKWLPVLDQPTSLATPPSAPAPLTKPPGFMVSPSPSQAEMVLVPAGATTIGDRRVEVGEFFVSRDTITVGEFERFMRQTDYYYQTPYMPACNFGKPDRSSEAMNCVSWNDAMAYAKWARRDLPSEAEMQRVISLGLVASAGKPLSEDDEPAEWIGDRSNPDMETNTPADRRQSGQKLLLKTKSATAAALRDIASSGRYRPAYVFRVVQRKSSN